jgi:hypothetical protein
MSLTRSRTGESMFEEPLARSVEVIFRLFLNFQKLQIDFQTLIG